MPHLGDNLHVAFKIMAIINQHWTTPTTVTPPRAGVAQEDEWLHILVPKTKTVTFNSISGSIHTNEPYRSYSSSTFQEVDSDGWWIKWILNETCEARLDRISQSNFYQTGVDSFHQRFSVCIITWPVAGCDHHVLWIWIDFDWLSMSPSSIKCDLHVTPLKLLAAVVILVGVWNRLEF